VHPPSSGDEWQGSEALEKAFASALQARAMWARGEIEGEETDYSDFGITHMMLGDTFRPRPKAGKTQ
jgi:hypothetical protein